jgi:hypothetical protein
MGILTLHAGMHSLYSRSYNYLLTYSETAVAIFAITYFLWLCSPARATTSSFTRFLYHTQRRATVGLLWTSDQLVAETFT